MLNSKVNFQPIFYLAYQSAAFDRIDDSPFLDIFSFLWLPKSHTLGFLYTSLVTPQFHLLVAPLLSDFFILK